MFLALLALRLEYFGRMKSMPLLLIPCTLHHQAIRNHDIYCVKYNVLVFPEGRFQIPDPQCDEIMENADISCTNQFGM